MFSDFYVDTTQYYEFICNSPDDHQTDARLISDSCVSGFIKK